VLYPREIHFDHAACHYTTDLRLRYTNVILTVIAAVLIAIAILLFTSRACAF